MKIWVENFRHAKKKKLFRCIAWTIMCLIGIRKSFYISFTVVQSESILHYLSRFCLITISDIILDVI